jgi:phosphate transporter
MDPKIDWASWFAVALPVSAISIILIWWLLLVSYKPARSPDGEGDIEIKAIRPTKEPFTVKQYWVIFVCLFTIGLWCIEHTIDEYVGDMGVIALLPVVLFFSTNVLKKVSNLCLLAFISLSVSGTDLWSGKRTTLSVSCGRSYSWLWEVSL